MSARQSNRTTIGRPDPLLVAPLVVPADRIVHNLHEAYQQIRFEGPRFGAFIAGPSKTADIEQSLVIGAHGPKSTTVFVVG